MDNFQEIPDNIINLIELCNRDPILANSIVNNANCHPYIYNKVLDGVPHAIFCSKPPTCNHLNKIICLRGSIIKIYETVFKNVVCAYQCLKCNETFCSSDNAGRKSQSICESCGSTSLKTMQDFQRAISCQTIRIQDIGNPGSMSETTEVLLEGENAGKFVPGDKVIITGVVLRKWKPLRVNEPMVSTLYLRALKVSKEKNDNRMCPEIRSYTESYSEMDDFEKRSIILNSFASEIVGNQNVKLGLILGLIGGSAENNRDTSAARESIHILMVGDPASGKSHLLKTAVKLVTPAILMNAIGTSDAGLTSCAVRQGKEWVLEAGALVLADLGICCIDEFNRLKVNEKSGLLESMEQQTLSVAKAGIVTSLNTRCSIFASSGTRYNYDLKKTVSDNLGLTTPLVSRFDLIFGMFDKRDKLVDDELARNILSRGIPSKSPESHKWPHGVLKTFISQCRKRKNKIDEELSQILLKYYHKKRKIDGRSEFNTIRMLESLIRLAEAHSKLVGREEVSLDDAYVAIFLNESSINVSESFKINSDQVFTNKMAFERTKERIKKFYEL